MARMMKAQMDHARGRLQCIRADKCKEMPRGKEFTPADLIDALSSGERKLTPPIVALAVAKVQGSGECGHYRRTYAKEFADALVEEVFKKDIAKEKVKYNKAMDKWQKDQDKVNKEFNRIEDEIILGDVDRAVELLEEFANLKV